MSVLAFRRASHLAAEGRGHDLHAVADPQDRNADIEEPWSALRSTGIGDACRSPGQDQANRPASTQLFGRCVERQDLRVDKELAEAPGDQLRVLRTEVENEYRLVGHRSVCAAVLGRIGICGYPDQMPLL